MAWLADGCHYAFPGSQENKNLFERAQQTGGLIMEALVMMPEGLRVNTYVDEAFAGELPTIREKVAADLGRGVVAGHRTVVRETTFPSGFSR